MRKKQDEPIKRASGRRLESYWREVTESRSLSTFTIVTHLEVESLMEHVLRQVLPKPEKLFKGGNQEPTFAQKLRLLEAHGLVEGNTFSAIHALNRLRNHIAHEPGYLPSLDEVSRFMAAMSRVHALAIFEGTKTRKLLTLEQLRSHFQRIEKDVVVRLVFISLMLLKESARGLLKAKEEEK